MCSSFQMWQRNTEEPIIALPPTWLVSIVILNVSSHFFEAKKILPSNIDSTLHFQVGTGARRNINVEVNTLIFTAWTWRMVAWFGDNSRVPQLTCIWMSLPEASGLGKLTMIWLLSHQGLQKPGDNGFLGWSLGCPKKSKRTANFFRETVPYVSKIHMTYTFEGNSFIFIVSFPNPLAPGSGIQIHVSWGTRLVCYCCPLT